MHNLPLVCMTKEIGSQIGSTIGMVKEVDVNEDEIGWGSYRRVRIKIDLRRAISRGRTFNLLGKKSWVTL